MLTFRRAQLHEILTDFQHSFTSQISRKPEQEAQLPLREQGVSLVLSPHYNTIHVAFLELRVGFVANLHGNECMHASVYKNSTHGHSCSTYSC